MLQGHPAARLKSQRGGQARADSVWGRPMRAALFRLSKIWLTSRASEMVMGTTLGSK